MGESPNAMKTRTCLKCSKPFNSKGPGNRICKRCTQKNNQVSQNHNTERPVFKEEKP